MRRIFFAAFFFATAVTGTAQISKVVTANSPVVTNPNTINKAALQVKPVPNIDRDLKLTITKIEKDNSNFDIGLAGIYTIYYDITNTGMAALDISQVNVQAYLLGPSGNYIEPIGGLSLSAAYGNTSLQPGKRYSGKRITNGFVMPAHSANKYAIKAGPNTAITTLASSNNVSLIPIGGNLEASSTPLPDLTFEVRSITPVTGGGYLNARWDTWLVNTGAGEIPAEIVNRIIPMVQVYPAGSPGTNLYNEAYFMGPRTNGTQVIPGYNVGNGPLKPGGKINISGASHINGFTSGSTLVFHYTVATLNNGTVSETNTANNTVDFLYTVK